MKDDYTIGMNTVLLLIIMSIEVKHHFNKLSY